MHKRAKKAGFKLDEYNRLKAEAAQIESDLRRLRDPLFLRSPPTSTPTTTTLLTTDQAEKDRLFQTALSSPAVAVDASNQQPPFTQRLANIFQSATKKLKSGNAATSQQDKKK